MNQPPLDPHECPWTEEGQELLMERRLRKLFYEQERLNYLEDHCYRPHR